MRILRPKNTAVHPKFRPWKSRGWDCFGLPKSEVGSQDFHLFCRILQEFSFNINKIETSLRNVIK